MKKSLLIAIIALPLLTGCGFLQKVFSKDTEPVGINTKVVVDPKLLQLCEPLQKLPAEPTFDDIATHYIETIGMYGTCANKQATSVSTIKKLANIKE